MIRQNNPKQAVFQQLMSTCRRRPAPKPEDPGADYDWSTPHRFTREQAGRLAGLAALAAEQSSKAMSDLLKSEQSLAAGEIVQTYAEPLGQEIQKDAAHYIALAGDDGRACGWVAMPPDSAIGCVSRLLGGGNAAAAQRALSSLESTLLADVFGALVKGLSAALTTKGAKGVRVQGELLAGAAVKLPTVTDEYCRLPFGAGADGKAVATALILSDWLEPVAAGAKIALRPLPEIKKDLSAYVGQGHVEATVNLGVARVTMKDLLALEEGDVLVLDVGVNEPVELLVQGQAVLTGLPVVSGGHYALSVASPAAGMAPRPSPKTA